MRPLFRRLLPLNAASFFQGLVFWYAIEKLFMQSIGFTYSQIGLMVALYSVVMLVLETPAGMLADRWSRKGVLMLASVALALAALVGGLSHSVSTYLVQSMLWGAFFGLYTGTYDAIVYDALSEDGKTGELFDRVYGWVRIAESIALVIGSLVGGWLAHAYGLRAPYFASILPALLAIVALAVFREPMLHKAREGVGLLSQVRQTLGVVVRSRALRPIMILMIMSAVLEFTLFEFDQLWLLALAAPLVLYGPINASILSLLGLGGVLAPRFRDRWLLLRVMLLALAVSSVGLALSRTLWLTVACQLVVILSAIIMQILLTRDMHDQLPSHIRAGAASAIGTLSRVGLIIMALVFGYVTQHSSVFTAAWLIAALAVPTAALFWARIAR
jgi:MFS family permease